MLILIKISMGQPAGSKKLNNIQAYFFIYQHVQILTVWSKDPGMLSFIMPKGVTKGTQKLHEQLELFLHSSNKPEQIASSAISEHD